MDNLSKVQRSYCMSRIRSRGTSPELLVRRMIHGMGYRFRLHRQDLPGVPDIVLPRFKIALFVNGCFWHQHKDCSKATLPKSNVLYWEEKLSGNVRRDNVNVENLKIMGWHVVTIWQCETEDHVSLAQQLQQLFLEKQISK